LSPDSPKQDISGNQVNALAGITYRVMPDFLVGIFGGYESFNYDVASLNGHLRGDGWTAGGYAGWRLLPGLRVDAGLAQSGIAYQGAAAAAAGSFPGSRTLFTTALTGLYRLTPGLELEPSARVYALWEKEDRYRDSLGTPQAERNFSTGRASLGTKLTYRWALSSTTPIAPFAGVYVDNYFITDDAGTAAIPAAMQGTSARVIGGVSVITDYGLKFSSAAELGGLGGHFTAWTFRARGAVPF
jgi:outer membrane autotransporter protein